MASAIHIDHVSISLGGRFVIDGLSMEFTLGDCVALIGGNGSGKTTLLRAIMGFVRYERGEINLFGVPVSSRAGARQRGRIAYVPQAPALDFKIPVTVRDVVSMGRFSKRGICRRLTADDRDAIDKSMIDAGIAHLAGRPIGHLSGGERQKAQFARALCQKPDVLLLDEPTGNLDLGAQYECLDLIEDVHANQQLTTVIVMHDLQAIPRSCNRAIVIDDGSKVFDGRFEDVFERENLAHLYKHRAERVMDKLLSTVHVGEWVK